MASVEERPIIVLDLAPLGYAFARRTAARGIHRVCKELFEGLLASGKCRLRFVATSDLAGVHAFLSHGYPPLLSDLYFPSGQLVLSRWAARADRWIGETLAKRSYPYRVIRFALHWAARWVERRSAYLPARVLVGADIYHSTFAPIPPEVLSKPQLSHFITVHDLLPITNPESVAGRGVRDIREIIDPLSEESFAFCTTKTGRDELLEHSAVRGEHVFISPLAADPGTFYLVTDQHLLGVVRSKYGIGADPYFLALSSFDPRKNFGHIIECFSKLVESEKLTACSLVIVGSNPEGNAFVTDAVAKYPKVASKIMLTGFVPDEDLAAIYTGALAFLFPSLAEGFGIPLLEAMQCGAPIISSNAPALPEILREAGLLLDPRDAGAWSEAMIGIATDRDLRETLVARGHERVQRFSWARFIEATFAGYFFALEKRAAPKRLS